MKKLLLLTILLLAFATSASAQEWFDFNGQALLPASVGQDLTMYSVVNNNGVIDTPIPLDFNNFEYTLVVTGMTLVMAMPPFQWNFSGAIVTIYEDAGTAADYSSPATFTDGAAILVGDMPLFTKMMFSSSMGAANGDLTWVAGTRLGEISVGERSGWSFLTSISNRSSVTEPGYDENWDGKVELVVVPNDETSLGELKARF